MEKKTINSFTSPAHISGTGAITQGTYAGNAPLLAEIHLTEANLYDTEQWPDAMGNVIATLYDTTGAEPTPTGMVLQLGQYPKFDKDTCPFQLTDGDKLSLAPGMSIYIFQPKEGELPAFSVANEQFGGQSIQQTIDKDQQSATINPEV